MKNCIAVVLLLLFQSILSAQCNLNLSGKITDLDNGEELAFSVVRLIDVNRETMTDAHGKFTFGGLCEGKYTLLVKHFGCRDTSFNVNLSKNTKLQVKLPHSAFELTEVDVMDKRSEMKKTQTTDELSGQELDNARGKSLGEALKSITGVTTFNTGGTISKPMIHGMQGYRVLILNNGIRQEGQQWGNEHAPEIDPFIAKKISVIKGAMGIRYGSDAVAGVILVEPDDLPDTASVTGEINLVGLSNGQTGNASAIIQGYFDKLKYLSWRIQGSYKKGGNLKTPQYYLVNTGVEEQNFSYALAYHRKRWGAEIYYSQFNTKIGIFKGAHAESLSDLQNAYAQKKPLDSLAGFSYNIGRPYQDVSHELIKGSAHYHFATRWRLKFQYAWQYNIRQEYDLHVPLSQQIKALNKADLDYRITTQSADILVEHDNIRSFRGQIGGSYLTQSNVYLGRFFIPNFLNNTWGLFATERYVKQHVEFEAGLRYDEKYLHSYYYEGSVLKSPFLSFKNTTYNAGFIWKPDSTFNCFINAGSAWRAPAPNELYSNGIHHGVGSIERGNEFLKSERVYNLTATAAFKRKYLSGEFTVYHNQFQNFIYLNPSGQSELTIRGSFPVFNYLQANVRISGADAKFVCDFTKNFSTTAKGMWVRGWNYKINDYLVYMPADRGELQLKYTFDLKRVMKQNFIQINGMYVAKQWRVPDSTDFAAPPEAYTLLGFDIGTKLCMKKQEIKVIFSATNLLNATYRDYLDRFRYFCDAQGVSYNLKLIIPLVIYDKK